MNIAHKVRITDTSTAAALHPERVRVAIVAESFLPHMNGVTGSVLQIVRHLQRTGHPACVIAPHAPGLPQRVAHARVEGVPSLALPGYNDVRVASTSTHRVAAALGRFNPDVVYLASPFALGWRGALAAARHNLPVVANYQTDVVSYAGRYVMAPTMRAAQSHVTRVHRHATLNLVPSQASATQLTSFGVDRLRHWARGVDAERFHPDRRDGTWQRPHGETLIGYVGRLAPEKQVEDLAVLAGLPGCRLVIVGDGPARPHLEKLIPQAVFLGHLEGTALATAMASFDIFVHPGESDTFGQTLQEAHASGVPVVATGRGGPLDLVRPGTDGWLYRPGDLTDLVERVEHLIPDAVTRRAFGAAGRAAVEHRTWPRLCDQLLDHFEEAQYLHGIDRSRVHPRARRSEPAVPRPGRWKRYVAMGDSLTEGLCDPAPDGTLRGWADRLALLLAARDGLDYANLAVRSRRVAHVAGEQLAMARLLRPDLVSILIGANDMVRMRVDLAGCLAQLESTVTTLRADGADVLLVTPFLPGRREAHVYAARFARFASAVAEIAERTGAILLDTDLIPEIGERPHWGADLVHLSPRGHRLLAYRAGALLGVPLAVELSRLDEVLHEHEQLTRTQWWRHHALPWVWRRLHCRVAGDGRVAKHAAYVRLGRDFTSIRESAT